MKCSELFDRIDALMEEYIRVWEDVCNLESPTNDKKGIDAVCRYFVSLAERKGWNVELFRQKIAGDVVKVTFCPDAKAAPVVFSGHMDTVHPVGSFGTPAVHIDGDRIYGPGVCDCKGGVVAAFLAMDALMQCGFSDRPVICLLQSDEEVGSALSGGETIGYICEQAKGAVAFLNCENAQADEVTMERKGIVRYRFTVTGIAGHSSTCYDAANAVTEAAHKIIKLEELKAPDGLTCNCGVISGGTVPNSVAETCTFTADIRFATEAELTWVRSHVAEIAASSAVQGCTCTVEQVSFRPAMERSDLNFALLDTLNRIYDENGLTKLTAQKGMGGSDAAYITRCGIPCVDSVGIIGGHVHSVREYAEISSLAESAKRLAAAAYCI